MSTNDSPCCGATGRDASVTITAPEPLAQFALAQLLAAPHPHHVVPLAGGGFWMGSDDVTYPEDREGPVRWVSVDPFAIDAHATSNARYATFVQVSGYRSDAERLGGSFVFAPHLDPALRHTSLRVPGLPWWRYVAGACWFAPEGPGSNLAGRADHPVVHLSWRDAAAFAAWAGGRLPNEAEWEFAARGGLDHRRFPWGDELEPAREHRCNVFQGTFPDDDSGADGYRGTAPVDAYAPNDFGLFNVVGNVWEWCDDTFLGRPGTRVRKGGSHLCHDSYCRRYRLAARTSGSEDDSAGNVGLRLAYTL